MSQGSDTHFYEPRVAESPVNFECRVTRIERLSDAAGNDLSTWLVLGEVIGVHIERHLLDAGIYVTKARSFLCLRARISTQTRRQTAWTTDRRPRSLCRGDHCHESRSGAPFCDNIAGSRALMIAVMQDDLVRRHRLTVQDYYRMAEVGLLAPDARVELIEGEIIDMPPSGPPHAGILSLLNGRLSAAAHEKAIVRPQLPLRLDDFSEPEPDFVVAKPKSDLYFRSHPVPSETLLVIEVSQSSLIYDRKLKLRLYARHGIPEYWIVDVVKPALHVFHAPEGERYLRSSSTPRPRIVTLRTLPELKVDLTGLFQAL